MNPAPPVTRILIRPTSAVLAAASGTDLDLAVIAEHEPVRLGHPRGRSDLHAPPDQRRLDPANPADRSPSQHDRVLDLAVRQQAARADRGERPHVRPSDLAVRTDDNGADDPGAPDAGAFLDHHPADELAVIIDLAVTHGFGGLEHHPVDLEHVGDVAGVLPVPGDQARLHWLTRVNEALNSLGDLQLASPRRLEIG